MCPRQRASLPVHCVLSFVSSSLEPWEWYSPDSFAFMVLNIVYVLPVTDIWLNLENRREAESIVPSLLAVLVSGRVGFLYGSFCSGCGAMSSALACGGLWWVASSSLLTALEVVPLSQCLLSNVYCLNVYCLIKRNLLQCHALFYLWDLISFLLSVT